MTNERLIEIMELAIDELSYTTYRGLCHLSNELEFIGKISFIEQLYFREYVADNAPLNNYDGYRWPIYQSVPRIEWLQQQIKTLKTQQ